MTDTYLYGARNTNAWRVQWMLNELGIEYEHVGFDIHAPGASEDAIYQEILRLNPNATVPVLKRGDDVVWDSLAINLYLADSLRKLCPPDGLMKAVQWSLWAAGIEDAVRTAQSHHSRLPEAHGHPEVAAQARDALVKPFDRLDAWLERSNHLAGSEFSVADLNVMCVLAHLTESGISISQWPHLERWMGECGARPALTRVFE